VLSAPPRPPRPPQVSWLTRLSAAEDLGMKPSEVIDVADHPLGRLVTTHDGCKTLLADLPDSLGQTGLLYVRRPGVPVPAGLAIPVYADPDEPHQLVDAKEPWLLGDLETEARRLRLPPAEGIRDPATGKVRETRLRWVGADPVRGMALLLHYGERLGVTVQLAAVRNPEAAAARQVVLASGWLAEAEAARL